MALPRLRPTPGLEVLTMAEPTTVRCAICPRRFSADLAAIGKRYCSDRCKQAAKRRKQGIQPKDGPSTPLKWHRCDWCDRWFVRRTATRTCGPDCAADLRRFRRAERREANLDAARAADRARYQRLFSSAARNEPTSHTCQECGGTFQSLHHRARRYCSKACAKRVQGRSERHRRRQAMAASPETFTTRQIAERDGWTCHICGGSVPDQPWSNAADDPTLDHLVPLSAGGAHTMANVALAHFLCNSLRGATPLAA